MYREGLGQLTITNATDLDALAVLNDEPSNEPRRAIYIRTGESALLTAVRRGNYRLRFQFGSRWVKEGRFCESYGTATTAEAFQFKEGRAESGAGSRFEVTLHGVPSGGAEMQRLPDRPLPLP
jgi:hypothetical protein